MIFKKQNLETENIVFIDIGSYRIKSAYTIFQNGEFKILKKYDKKQEKGTIVMGNIQNIEKITSEIGEVLKELNPEGKYKLILNLVGPVFIGNVKIDAENPENLSEEIIKNKEKFIINTKDKIFADSFVNPSDQYPIYFSINIRERIEEEKKKIGISFHNFSTLYSVANMFRYLEKALKREIDLLVPQELSAYSNVNHKECLIIDVGNSVTKLIFIKNFEIIFSDTLFLGMNDLFATIKRKKLQSDSFIIHNLHHLYNDERKEFGNILKELVMVSLSNFYKNNPFQLEKVLFSYGAGNNEFLAEMFKREDFIENGIPCNSNLVSQTLKIDDKKHIFGMMNFYKKNYFDSKNEFAKICREFLDEARE